MGAEDVPPYRGTIRTAYADEEHIVVRFTTNGSSNPVVANTIDDAAMVDTIVYAATGKFTITLFRKFTYLFVEQLVLYDTTADRDIRALSTTEGTGAAAATQIQTLTDSTGAGLETTGKVVEVHLKCVLKLTAA